MLVLFLITSALYTVNLDAETEAIYWQGIGGFLIFGVFVDYFIHFIAFGYDPKNKKAFIFDTCICLFIFIGYALKESGSAINDQSN